MDLVKADLDGDEGGVEKMGGFSRGEVDVADDPSLVSPTIPLSKGARGWVSVVSLFDAV